MRGVDESLRLGVRRDAGHERAIDLDRVDGEPAQAGEARVPGAEVVDGDSHAQGLEAPQARSGGLGVA